MSLVFTPDSHPATGAFEVTPNDSADLAKVTRAVLIEVAGDLDVVMANGDEVVLPVQAGYNPLAVRRIKAANTTATGIFALTN